MASTYSVDVSLYDIPDEEYEYVMERIEDALKVIQNEVSFGYDIGVGIEEEEYE